MGVPLTVPASELQLYLSSQISTVRFSSDKIIYIHNKIVSHLVALPNLFYSQLKYNLAIILFVTVRVTFRTVYPNILVHLPIQLYGFINILLVIVNIQYCMTSACTDSIP